MTSSTNRLSDILTPIVLTALIIVSLACLAQATASLTDIKISFKMNPSITRGMYMGDRYISPPYYNVEEGKEITVEAIVQGFDVQGKQIDISAAWEASDPAMITISHDKGQKVTLTVLKDGQSELRVASGGVSKKLPVKAWYKENAMHVEIGQPTKQ